ncbi:uncharacterized protein LOC114472566 [Gouania willdenowi]|uniref:uncharacterized protein LOC114472566 n=1 Tax=Gouania willdenowi TaxID=441366 RepID=UPI0010551EB8|nr:uncharacterized protein LOC114472566 [Gouania willdenowi]
MESSDVGASAKRVSKPTFKVLEERLNQLIGKRKTKLSHLNGVMKEIDALMEDNCNAEMVNAKLATDFSNLFMDFCAVNDALKDHMTKEEFYQDQTQWFEPKSAKLNAFYKKVEGWLNRVKQQEEEARMFDAEVEPADSASMISARHSNRGCSSQCASGVSNSTSSARLELEAERAALAARIEALKQKQEIEREEAVLKAKKEEWELQTAIAAANAKLEVFIGKESSLNTSFEHKIRMADQMKAAQKNKVHSFNAVKSEHENPSQRYMLNVPQSSLTENNSRRGGRSASASNNTDTGRGSDANIGHLLNVMQRQNDITEFLVKQQRAFTLPILEVPVFRGDPLEFDFFMKAFEHGIEERTDNNRDRLRFLEQFTNGRPKVLVRSCSHMHPDRGYVEAKKLLNKHFGNEYTIASAYIEKALKWRVIVSEDAEALTEFSVFLTGCFNTVDSMEFIEEMDSPTNMRTVISKLPFRLRGKWRGVAYDIQENTGARARFKDLVKFVDKQAKIASHPLFGNIQDSVASKDVNKQAIRKESAPRYKEKKNIFAIDVTPAVKQTEAAKKDMYTADKINKRQCIFCNKGGHNLEFCKLIRQKAHKEKLDFLKSQGLCFGCLSQGHMSKGCQQRHICRTCSLKHPTILHYDKEVVLAGESAAVRSPSSNLPTATDSETCGCTGAGETACALSIVPVRVRCGKSNRTVETYAFLDSGSTGTFCSEELMKELRVTGKKTNILLRTMGNEASITTCVITGLEVSSLDNDNFLKLPQVYSQAEIPVKKDNIPRQTDVESWPYLKEVQLKQIEAEIGLLIGTNVPKALEPWKVVNSEGKGPYAVKTALGWTINGPLLRVGSSNEEDAEWPQLTVNRISVAKLEELTQQQIQFDFPEHNMTEKLEMSSDDKRFMESVSQSAKLVDGHYCIGLPLKNKDIIFPNNRTVAVQRTESLKRKMLKNLEFRNDYTKFMNDTLEKGYAEEIPLPEIQKDCGRIWYVPHHGVYHPTKHKLRVVFDCAATYQGISLNTELLQGPDLTSSLIGVLTRFRQEPIAFMSDIEGMFHQVKVPAKHTNLLRFLWWPQGDLHKELKEYRMVVHLFGATSSPSCATYALQKCAQEKQAEFCSEAVNTILKNFYVDDCLKSVSSEKEAVMLIQKLIALCATGGFKLTKWISNSREVLASIHEDDRAKDVKELDLEKDRLPIERALGVQWCVESDTLKFRVIIQSKPLTRRGVLSMVSSIYDPLGILAPLILPVKQILQELCRTKHAWDDRMPEALTKQWQKWLASLHQLANFEVKRCLKPTSHGETTYAQLHHFCDASETGYGTVTYLLSKNDQGQVFSAFIIGKARVTPLKPVTIPRLELTAATVSVKMDTVMTTELDLDLKDSVFWTDSTSVIQYLKNETARYRTFVANRVATIRESSNISQWRYVNTFVNPADFASRGLTVEAFLKEKTWIMGPDFLTKSESEWPETPDNILCQPLCNDPEVKEASVYAIHAEESMSPVSQLIHHYSINDIAEAELEIVRFSQKERFSNEIAMLQKGKVIPKGNPLCRLSPALQEDLPMRTSVTVAETMFCQRFVARRGQVKLIRSDNGTNFVGTERELREAVQAMDKAKIQSTLVTKGITWLFNPPAASHFGGIWERQIKTIRKVLNSVVKQQTIDEEGLHTLMCEVEAIINSRPITRVSDDPNDLEALSPNHLLLMKVKTPLPPGLFNKADLYSRLKVVSIVSASATVSDVIVVITVNDVIAIGNVIVAVGQSD